MKLGKVDNKTGSKVEAHVASCPVLSLFRREEPKDGDTVLPYTLHNYRSTATPYIPYRSFDYIEVVVEGNSCR